MANNNTSNTNAVNNKEANTMSNNQNIFSTANVRMVASAPAVWGGDILAAGAEVCRKAAEFIGGGEEKRVVGYNYLAARATGSLTKSAKAAMLAVAKAAVEEGAQETKKEAKEEKTRWNKHSDYAAIKEDGYWEDSQKAKDESKGMPSLYKGANKLRFAIVGKKGWGYTPKYKDGEGKLHNLAGWVTFNVIKHAGWREGQGDKDVWTSESLNGYLATMVWLAMDAHELEGVTIPSFEELVSLSGESWNEEEAPKAEPTKEEVEQPVHEDGLPHDGMAPATPANPTVSSASRSLAQLAKDLKYGRVTEGNVLRCAAVVKAAREAGLVNDEELSNIFASFSKRYKGDEAVLKAALGIAA